jgi:predicted NAD/FAD-dependent oxidoreductase
MRVVVVGAGLSGLVAGRALAPDHDVTLVDKGRSVGGRLATRRIGDARLDHGAQFFTVRGASFRAQVDDWIDRGLVHEWCRGFAGGGDGHPRYVGTAGMNSLAKDLADGLDCRTGSLVFTLHRHEAGWSVVLDDGSSIDTDAIVLTAPLAQSWALLVESELDVPEELYHSPYHRTIGLLTVLDGPGAVPAPGGVQFDPADDTAPFGFIGDNHAKRVSPVPAITFHATQPWSLEHWEDDTETLREQLLGRAAPWLGDATVEEAQVKKWRFAAPAEPLPDPCWVHEEYAVVLAGDVFAGPKVEGAFNSGLAAAAAVRAL